MSKFEDIIIPGPVKAETEHLPVLEITPAMRETFTDLRNKFYEMSSGYQLQNDLSFSGRCSDFKHKIYGEFGMDAMTNCYLSHIFGSTVPEELLNRYDFEGGCSVESFINQEYERFKNKL